MLLFLGERAGEAVRTGVRGDGGETGAGVGDLDATAVAVDAGGDAVFAVCGVFYSVGASLGESDGQVVADVRIDAGRLHGPQK
jgi:hypothetical protein